MIGLLLDLLDEATLDDIYRKVLQKEIRIEKGHETTNEDELEMIEDVKEYIQSEKG